MPKGKGYNLEKDIEYLQTRHKKAAAKLKPKAKKKKKEDWVTRLKRQVQMLLQGEKYQSPAMKKKKRGY